MPLVTRFDCSGFCGRCLGWLGSPKPPTSEQSKAGSYDIWAARQIASLLAFPPSTEDCHLVESMTMLTDKQFSGVQKAFGHALGRSKATVSGWLSGQHRPSLRNALEISYVFRVPLLGLLRCDRAAIARSQVRPPPFPVKGAARAVREPRDVAADIRFLREVAEGRHPLVRTEVELTDRLSVTAATLRRNCGAEYRAARAYQRAALHEARRLAREKFEGELELKVRAAHDSLVRACRSLSRRAVLSEMERLGSKPVGRQDMLLVIEFYKRAADSGNSQTP